MNKNNKLAVAPVLLFDSVFASSRWQHLLFRLECHPQRFRKLRMAMSVIAEAAMQDAAGLQIDRSKVFAALELCNDESQTVANMDDPLSL